MNRTTLLLSIVMMLLLITVSYRFYTHTKEEALEEYRHFFHLQQTMQTIAQLKAKYSKKPNLFSFKNLCTIQNGRFITLNCLKLDSKNFAKAEKLLFKRTNKIHSYSIKRAGKYVEVTMELER